jgi:hypothetical protein
LLGCYKAPCESVSLHSLPFLVTPVQNTNTHTHTHIHIHTYKQKPHKLPILSSSKIQLKTKTKKASNKERQATKLQRKLPKANKRD